LTPPEFADVTARAADELAERGETAPYEKQMIRKDGTRWWGLFAPTRLGGSGPASECVEFVIDITETKRAQAALRESEARLRRILDSETVGVVFFDHAGTVLDANTAFWKMTGYTPADTRDRALSWRTMTPPEWVAASEAQMEALAATGRIGPYEKEYQRKDGTRLWLLFAGRDLGDGTIVEFVIDVSERKRLEAERERLRVAEAVAAERQALLDAVVRAQEEERRHLARELHDEIGQALTGLQLQLAAFARGQNGRAAALETEQIVRDLTARVSNLSVDLRPSALDTLGLLPALLSHVQRFQARTSLRIDLRHDGLDRRFPSPVEITAYRVVQEALTNVVRHAGARSATVQLLADEEALTLAVRDDGRGFDLHASRRTGGLSGMRERVELLGGTLTIDTATEQGTLITAELPLHEGATAALQADGA
jgi:PAS domain S-box-containing protein